MLSQENLNKILNDYKNSPESLIISTAETLVCLLASDTIDNVVAYRNYVSSKTDNFANPIQNIENFKSLPLTSKQEYLRKYKRNDLKINNFYKKFVLYF